MNVTGNCRIHNIYIDYPLNAAKLKKLEDRIHELELSIGDMVVVDCNGMDYICSSGLRYFLKLYHETAAKACKLVIKGLHPLVKGVFDMSGFSHIFNIEE